MGGRGGLIKAHGTNIGTEMVNSLPLLRPPLPSVSEDTQFPRFKPIDSGHGYYWGKTQGPQWFSSLIYYHYVIIIIIIFVLLSSPLAGAVHGSFLLQKQILACPYIYGLFFMGTCGGFNTV
jgi:hypothetical protein